MHYTSHTGQDRWVAEVLKGKRGGYFLDFGGFDGLMTSNTFYLEKFLGWTGIMVEPNPQPYASACAVRSCITANYALWGESRKSLEFANAHGLSSILSFVDCDSNAALRKSISKETLRVDTINPTELLDRFKAPEYIDYMSLDVEGAEIEVLKSIDLERYKIALMSIEHNHEEVKRAEIRKYLDGFGYISIAHRNDDLFYNRQHLQVVSVTNYSVPEDVQSNVIETYKLREF